MLSPPGLELALAALAFALLGLSLPALALAAGVCWRDWREADAGSGRLLLVALVLAAALRWLVFPRWLAMVFIGYRQTAQAIDLLPLSHYGAGAAALPHALFALLPRDHATLMAANSLIGVLTLPLWAAVAARVAGSARVGAVFALAVAATPLFIRNDNSEANNVAPLLWLAGGALLWLAHRRQPDPAHLLGAAALCTFAASSRPEAPALVGALLLALTLATRRPGLRLDALSRALVLAGGLALVPHLVHVLGAASEVGVRPPGELWKGALAALGPHNVLLKPTLFPVGLLPLAVYGAATRRAGRVALGLAVFAVALYGPDICRGNMARVQVPAALLLTFAAALGGARVAARWRWTAQLALAALVAASAAWTAPHLYAPTNEQAEEEFLRAALAALPREPKVLIRHGYLDLNRERSPDATQQHFPDYLVPQTGPTALRTIAEFRAAPRFDLPVYAYWGVRCQARFRREGTPPPRGALVQPACAALRRDFRLEPVLQREVPNRGDVWLEYYSDQPTLHLALYRVRPRAPALPGAAARP